MKDIIEITYQVSTKVAKVKFKEKIYLSQAKDSRCMQLVHELYKDTLPETVSFKENIGRKVILTFSHKKDAQENTYDNIVKRVFHN